MTIQTTPLKPVIYLLPGLLCDETVWQAQQQTLEEDFDVRIPSFRGFSSFKKMAEHVLKDSPDKFSIAAHSMGARVALELLKLCPERIDKVVLMSLGSHPVQEGEAQKRMVLVDLAEQQGMEALAKVWILPMLNPARHKDEELIENIRTMILRSSASDYRGQIEAALNRANQWNYLEKITQEVLLICGEQDSWSPVEQHEAILAQLPKAQLEVVANAGHMVTMEQPLVVSAILKDWLTCNPA